MFTHSNLWILNIIVSMPFWCFWIFRSKNHSMVSRGMEKWPPIIRERYRKTSIRKFWISSCWGVNEFAKSRGICTMRACLVSVTTCQKRANFWFLRTNVQLNVPTSQRRTNYSTWWATVSKTCQFFNFAYQKVDQFFSYFSKEFFYSWIFQLCLTFANFRNIWAIVENLSYET